MKKTTLRHLMKAKDLLLLWLLATVFSAAPLFGCSKPKPEEQVPYWVEEGEPAQNSKEEWAKWHQESVALMKALQALEVTSKRTEKKRKVIWFTDSTLEKAEAAAKRFYPAFKKVGDAVDVGIIETDKSIIKLLAKNEGNYLAEAILRSVGHIVSFVHGIEIKGKETTTKESFLAKANKANKAHISRKNVGRIGSIKFSEERLMSEMTTDDPSSNYKLFRNRVEMRDEYKVEGKAGRLIAWFVLKVEDFDKVSLARVNRSLQEDGLSMVDFVGGLLEEGNNIYTLIICADKKGEEFSVYLIFNKEKSDKEKAGSDE